MGNSQSARNPAGGRGGSGKRKQAQQVAGLSRTASIRRSSGGIAKRKASVVKTEPAKRSQVAAIATSVRASPLGVIDQNKSQAQTVDESRDTPAPQLGDPNPLEIQDVAASSQKSGSQADESELTFRAKKSTDESAAVACEDSENQICKKPEVAQGEAETETDRETKESSAETSGLPKVKSMASKSRENIAVESSDTQPTDTSSFGRKFFPFGSGSLLQRAAPKSTRILNADGLPRKPLRLLSRSTSFYVSPVAVGSTSQSGLQTPQLHTSRQPPQTAMAIARANIKALLGVGSSSSGTATPAETSTGRQSPQTSVGQPPRQLISSSLSAMMQQQQALPAQPSRSSIAAVSQIQRDQELLTEDQRKRIRDWLDSQPPIGGPRDQSTEMSEEFAWMTTTTTFNETKQQEQQQQQQKQHQRVAGKLQAEKESDAPPIGAEPATGSEQREAQSGCRKKTSSAHNNNLDAGAAAAGSSDATIMEMEAIEEQQAPPPPPGAASRVTWPATEVAPVVEVPSQTSTNLLTSSLERRHLDRDDDQSDELPFKVAAAKANKRLNTNEESARIPSTISVANLCSLEVGGTVTVRDFAGRGVELGVSVPIRPKSASHGPNTRSNQNYEDTANDDDNNNNNKSEVSVLTPPSPSSSRSAPSTCSASSGSSSKALPETTNSRSSGGSEQTARSSLLEFRLPVADDKCSLCHYLISIREMANRQPDTPTAPTSPSFECHRRPRSRLERLNLGGGGAADATITSSPGNRVSDHHRDQLTLVSAECAPTNEPPPPTTTTTSQCKAAGDGKCGDASLSRPEATAPATTALLATGTGANRIETDGDNQVRADDTTISSCKQLTPSPATTFGFRPNLAHLFSSEVVEFCDDRLIGSQTQVAERLANRQPPAEISGGTQLCGGSCQRQRMPLKNTRGFSLDGHRGANQWQQQQQRHSQLHKAPWGSSSSSSHHAHPRAQICGRRSRGSSDKLSQSNRSLVSSRVLVISSNNVSYAIQVAASQAKENESGQRGGSEENNKEIHNDNDEEDDDNNNNNNNHNNRKPNQQVGRAAIITTNKSQVIESTYGNLAREQTTASPEFARSSPIPRLAPIGDSSAVGSLGEQRSVVSDQRDKFERKLCASEHQLAQTSKAPAREQTSAASRADTCKKFLVKKISNSNIKDFIKKQQIKQQANLTKRKPPHSSTQLTSSISSPSFPQHRLPPFATPSQTHSPEAGAAAAAATTTTTTTRASGPPSIINSEDSAPSIEFDDITTENDNNNNNNNNNKLLFEHKQMDKHNPATGQPVIGARPKTADPRKTPNQGQKNSLLAASSSSVEAAMNSLRAAKMLDHHQTIDHRSLMDSVRLDWQAAQAGDALDVVAGTNPVSPGGSGAAGGGGGGTTGVTISDEATRSAHQAAKRLRELTAHLEHGSVPRSVLYETLEFAASVLDSVAMDQISRVSDEEDGDLSEVQSDAVPNEVRKWLETTFTRNSISQKRKSEDKLKFRSVANAIRAGIVVDRIYRRMSASTPFISQEVSGLLKCIDDWSFDCFNINQVSNGQVLKSIGYELFNRYGLMYKFKIPTTTLKNFLTQIESGYTKHKNPYHNNLHAADVTQTVHHLMWQAGLTNWLTDLEIFATLLAAIIHDYLHTGTTNNFHVMSQSDTALLYNDRAVLENFHICQAFTLMRNEDCNILAGLSKDEFREFRSLVIDMVLATDMSSHFQQIKAMKNILNHSDNFSADKSKILSLVIHISDISHPAKEWELHSQWTGLLMEEFFRQGDREKELNLECSPLCDRETTLVAESQLGFIEFIVSPSLEICGDVLDRVQYQMAEANTRPVLPASAKTASILASTTTPKAITAGSGGLEKGEAPVERSNDGAATPASRKLSGSQVSVASSSGGSNLNSSSTSSHSGGVGGNGGGGASFASSFVSSETLTSNLRKMIVSSSATLGRKLTNLSGSQQQQQPSSGKSRTSTSITSANAAGTGNASEERRLSAQALAAAAEKERDFEARQANYQHPVIRCDSSSRPKSSVAPAYRQQSQQLQSDTISQLDNKSAQQAGNDPTANQLMEPRATPSGSSVNNSGDTSAESRIHSAPSQAANSTTTTSVNNQLQQLQPTGGKQLDRLTAQPADLASAKRSSNSSLHLASQTSSRSAPPLHYVKIQRPWIKCLERNKKMWQERAIVDAEARQVKERQKQRAIQEAPPSDATSSSSASGADNNKDSNNNN